MKKIILISLVALGLTASASAQLGSTGTLNHLILGFRDNGSVAGSTGTSTNLTFDLGTVASLTTGGVIDLGNIGSSLSSTYGSGWASDTGLLFGVVGTNGNTTTTRDLFVSAAATGSPFDGVTATATPWTVKGSTTQSTQAAKFITVGANTLAGPLVATSASTSATTSWSYLETTVAAFGTYNLSAFEQNATGLYADVFSLNPSAGTGTASVLVGTLQLASSGEVSFVAVPEPATYAALLGLATLGVVMIRRRRQVAIEA